MKYVCDISLQVLWKGDLHELDTFGWMACEEFIGKIDKNVFSESKEKQKAKFGV